MYAGSKKFTSQGFNVAFYVMDISDKEQCVAAVKK